MSGEYEVQVCRLEDRRRPTTIMLMGVCLNCYKYLYVDHICNVIINFKILADAMTIYGNLWRAVDAQAGSLSLFSNIQKCVALDLPVCAYALSLAPGCLLIVAAMSHLSERETD